MDISIVFSYFHNLTCNVVLMVQYVNWCELCSSVEVLLSSTGYLLFAFYPLRKRSYKFQVFLITSNPQERAC